MRGETSIDPAAEGTIEVINPDDGNNEIVTDPASEDGFEAAERDARDDAETAEAETETENPDEDGTPDEVDGDTDDEVPAPAADGEEQDDDAFDLSTLPEVHRKKYEAALAEIEAKKKGQDKYFYTQAQKIAAQQRELDARLAEARADSAEGRNTRPAEPDGPPPLPLEPKDQAEWNAAVAAQNKWYAEQAVKDLEKSGKFVPADKVQALEMRAAAVELQAKIESMPGFTEAAGNLIVETLEGDQFWADAYARDAYGTMEKLAPLAISSVNSRRTTAEQADRETAKIQKKATAADRATARVSTPKRATPEDVLVKEGYMTEDERMDHAERLAREQ